MNKQIKVLLVDDHQLVIDGLKTLLTNEDKILVVGQAHDGQEALDKLETLEVDVVILDIQMDGMDGLEATVKIKDKYPNTKILIVTMHKNGGQIDTLIKSGADGYVLKDAGQKEFVYAINQLAGGDVYFGDEVMKIYVQNQRKKNEKPDVHLTSREVDVLIEIAEGNTSAEIAKKLHMATSTVDTHRRNLISKLGFKNSFQLVRYAIENGYLNEKSSNN